MGIVRRLFDGKKDDPIEEGRSSSEIRALVRPLEKSAVRISHSDAETLSYFGGDPTLPQSVHWPNKDGKPLTFLAALDLTEVSLALNIPWLPNAGRLLFFYDTEDMPWGFDPDDKGGWAVIHSESDIESNNARVLSKLPKKHVSLKQKSAPPSWERPEFEALQLTDAEIDTFCEEVDQADDNFPYHQIGGYPNNVQGDMMELECQLASNGLYCGDSTGYASEQASLLKDGAADWRLLLQMDSDDDLDVMWGDCGMIYFWIREQDARESRFDNVWLVLQCA